MSHTFDSLEDKIIAYYKNCLSLKSLNDRRKRAGLPEIDRLNGLTFEDKKRLGIPLSRYEHNGKKYYQIDHSNKVAISLESQL